MRRALTLAMAMLLLAALAVAVVGCGDDTTTTTAADTATTAPAGDGAVDGAAVFASTCAGCHGADGTGANGPDLTVRSDLTKDRVVDQVTNGGTSMPEYGSTLSTEEIDAVADYVLNDLVQ